MITSISIPCKGCGELLCKSDSPMPDECPHCGLIYKEKKKSEDSYTVVILKNLDNDSHKLTHAQIMKLRDTINSFPDSPDGLMIKLAFADALVDTMNQKDAPCQK